MPIDLTFADIAARSDISPARWRRSFLFWLDGIELGWAIPLLLLGFVAVWSAYFIIAYWCGDLHPDVLETWTLGRSLEWGYSKHPPLMGWAARAWTSVFPLTNWSFQLLAMTNAAMALWAVDLISRHFVRGDKRIVILLLLMLMPIYQFHAQRFNANAVLLAPWPLATYCFLRSFETRQVGWAVAAGATAALAMLGKYYSVFLIAGFAVAAICHPQRRSYYASSAPWISAAVGLVALGPHLYWLATTGARPFGYALATHAGKAFVPSLFAALLFILGLGLALVPAAVAWALIAGPSGLRKASQEFRAMDPGLALHLHIGVAAIILPAITAVILRSDMPPIWGLHGLFLLVIPVVCAASYPIRRFYSVNLAVLVIGMAILAATVVGPVHAIYRNYHPLHEGRNFYRLAAEELTRKWHAQSNKPLPTVGGDDDLAFAVAFYSPDHPVYNERLLVANADRLPNETWLQGGWAALCFGGDASCVASMERIALRTSRVSNFIESRVVVQSRLLEIDGAVQHFTAILVPPATGGKPAPPPAANIDDMSSRRRIQPSLK